jgi:hypothetical protein
MRHWQIFVHQKLQKYDTTTPIQTSSVQAIAIIAIVHWIEFSTVQVLLDGDGCSASVLQVLHTKSQDRAKELSLNTSLRRSNQAVQ